MIHQTNSYRFRGAPIRNSTNPFFLLLTLHPQIFYLLLNERKAKFLLCPPRRKFREESLFEENDKTQPRISFLPKSGKKRNLREGRKGNPRLRKSHKNETTENGFRLHDSISCIRVHRGGCGFLVSTFFFFLSFFFFFLPFFFFFTAEIFPNIRSRSRNQSDYPRYVASTRVHQHTRLVAAIGRGSRAFFHCSAVV